MVTETKTNYHDSAWETRNGSSDDSSSDTWTNNDYSKDSDTSRCIVGKLGTAMGATVRVAVTMTLVSYDCKNNMNARVIVTKRY